MSDSESECEFSVIQIKTECKNTVTSVDQFDKICRLCLSAETQICSIFELQYNKSNFSDLLHLCTSIHVEKDDTLPKNICYNCIKKVIEYNDFKDQCVSSEDTLKNILLQHDSIKNENIEIEEIIIVQQDEKESITQDEDTECKDINTENLEDEKKETDDEKPKGQIPLCYRCDAKFTTWEELEEHRKKEKHGTRKGKVCKYCNKTIFCLSSHLRVHTKEKPFQCHICARPFASKHNMTRHVNTHTVEDKEDKQYKCDICGTEFLRMFAYENHMKEHMGEEKSNTRKLYAGRIYTCSHCGKKFGIQTTYKYHLLTEHAVGTEEDQKNKCDPCKRVFCSSSKLKEHQKKVHGEKKYLCSHCGMGFYSLGALQTHQRQHTGEKPYQCPVCQKCFPYLNGLRCHLLTHSGERPFVCEVCRKGFTQGYHLKLHMLLHTGERPHVCTFCGKGFRLKDNLKVHVRQHTGETPFICDFCQKGFYDASSMRKHKKSHYVVDN